jgi:hypothetical protein
VVAREAHGLRAEALGDRHGTTRGERVA